MTTEVFSPDAVAALNEYQQNANYHPYTCGNDSRHRVLVATVNGWICLDCDYRQGWAHETIPGIHA